MALVQFPPEPEMHALAVTHPDMSPDAMSVAFTQASTNVAQFVIVSVAAPFSAIDGGVRSTMVTVRFIEAVLPYESATEYTKSRRVPFG